ncbi:MAG: hypothetical protein QXK18_08720 [Candidatus Bathyarchaeia archaeon]
MAKPSQPRNYTAAAQPQLKRRKNALKDEDGWPPVAGTNMWT